MHRTEENSWKLCLSSQANEEFLFLRGKKRGGEEVISGLAISRVLPLILRWLLNIPVGAHIGSEPSGDRQLFWTPTGRNETQHIVLPIPIYQFQNFAMAASVLYKGLVPKGLKRNISFGS